MSTADIIRKINTNIKACVDCPFLFTSENNGRRELMWGEGKTVLFVGQCPAQTNKEKQSGSRFDKFFEGIVRKSNIPFEETSFTNISKATLPASVFLTDEQKEHCFDHVSFETAHLKPDLVITLGTLAREWAGLENFGDTVTGKFVHREDDGSLTSTLVPIVSIEHPASVRYGRVTEGNIISRLNEAYEHRQRS